MLRSDFSAQIPGRYRPFAPGQDEASELPLHRQEKQQNVDLRVSETRNHEPGMLAFPQRSVNYLLYCKFNSSSRKKKCKGFLLGQKVRTHSHKSSHDGIPCEAFSHVVLEPADDQLEVHRGGDEVPRRAEGRAGTGGTRGQRGGRRKGEARGRAPDRRGARGHLPVGARGPQGQGGDAGNVQQAPAAVRESVDVSEGTGDVDGKEARGRERRRWDGKNKNVERTNERETDR